MPDDKIIYAQVLLLDEKIESWKICQDRKSSPYDFRAYWKSDRLDDYREVTRIFKEEEVEIGKGWTFNSYVYNVLAPEWINQWDYADNYREGRARVKTLDEVIDNQKSLMNALGGLRIISQLGEN